MAKPVASIAGLGTLIFILFFVICFEASSQTLKTDSVTLATVVGTKITKVVARTDSDHHMAVAWQTESADSIRLYLRFFGLMGSPKTEILSIARVITSRKMDFDLTMDEDGQTVLTWSAYDIVSARYKVMYTIYDTLGNSLSTPQVAGLATGIIVKTSSNNVHGFLIAWKDVYLNIRLYTKAGIADGALIKYGYSYSLLLNASTICYTKEKTIGIASLQEGSTQGFAMMCMLDPMGTQINYTFELNRPLPMTSLDCYYANDRMVFTFSNGTSTYMAMASTVTTSQAANIWPIDAVNSTVTQVAQNENGSVSAAWISSTGVLKTQILQPSGEPTGASIALPAPGATIGSFDVLESSAYESTVVSATNNATGGLLTLYHIRYVGPGETWDDVADPLPVYLEKASKALSSAKTHVAVWVHKEPTQSAIFAQVYDSLFKKTGSTINVTGFRTHAEISGNDQFFNMDSAIDSLGNFMVVWRTWLGNTNDISAVRFNRDGTVNKPEFKVNTAGDASIPARIGASGNGKFVIVWGSNNQLMGRKFDGNTDSGQKLVSCCLFMGGFSSDFNRSVVSVNNQGKFMYTFRDGYYGITFKIYDENMTEIASPLINNILDTYSDYDAALTNQDQILLTWTVDGNFPGIKFQRLDGKGVKVGSEILLDNTIAELRDPALAVNYNGEFAVSYQDNFYVMQSFTPQGVKTGTPRRFETFMDGAEVDMSKNPKGDVFLVWTGFAYSPGAVAPRGVIAKGIFRNAAINLRYFNVNRTINQGEGFVFGGETLTRSGRYSHLYQPDSLVTLTLQVIDTTPPSTPQWISLVPGDKFLLLNWKIVADQDLEYYTVYRGITDVFSQSSFLLNTGLTTYQDANVEYSKTYYYWIEAKDYSGNKSFSSSINGIPVNTPPAIPVWNSFYGADKYIHLNWKVVNDKDLKLYRIYRSTTNVTTSATVIATPTATAIDFDDFNVNYGQQYYYWIVAEDSQGQLSGFSSMQQGSPYNTPPAVPVGLGVTVQGQNNVLTWTANAESDFKNYIVYKSTTSSFVDAIVIGNPVVNTFSNAAIPGITVYFWLRAVDASGQTSSLSSMVSISNGQISQIIMFLPLASKTVNDGPFTLSATASSGLSVSYSSTNAAVATITGNVVTITGAGTTIIQATQNGNSEYLAAAMVSQSLIVKTPQQISMSPPAGTLEIGNSFILQAIATSGLSVSFSSSDPSIVSIENSTATVLRAGSVTITALQAGNDLYLPANTSITIQTTKKAQVIHFEQPSTQLEVGESFTLNANSSSGLPIAYSVSDVLMAGILQDVFTAIGPGVVTLTASQEGNETYQAAEPIRYDIVIATVTGNEISLGTDKQSLYPNPSTQWITVDLVGFKPAEDVTVKIIDALGHMVDQYSSFGNGQVVLNIESLQAGVYFVQLEQGKHRRKNRFVKL